MKTRRHHNNKGYRQIKRGKTRIQVDSLARRMGVSQKQPVLSESTKQYRYLDAEGNGVKIAFWVQYPDYDFMFGVPEKGSKRHKKEFAFFQFRRFDAKHRATGWSIYLDQCELEEMVQGFQILLDVSRGLRATEWKQYDRNQKNAAVNMVDDRRRTD